MAATGARIRVLVAVACRVLGLSTHINNIFTKLELPPAPDDNRRVLAVLAWLQGS